MFQILLFWSECLTCKTPYRLLITCQERISFISVPFFSGFYKQLPHSLFSISFLIVIVFLFFLFVSLFFIQLRLKIKLTTFGLLLYLVSALKKSRALTTPFSSVYPFNKFLDVVPVDNKNLKAILQEWG